VPDPKVGEEICVYLRPREGVNITEQDVNDYCKDKVSFQVRYLRMFTVYTSFHNVVLLHIPI
jgi:hypothetical protein